MGGINSLTGLNNVSVDFRPTVEPNAAAPKTDGTAVQQVVDPDEAMPPAKTRVGSIVRQLDVLLVNAASKSVAGIFEEQLKTVCMKLYPKDWQTEYENRVRNDKSITRSGDGTIVVDIAKASKSPEVKMAIGNAVGMQSFALPDEIDKSFYDRLMAMKKGSAERKAYLDSIAPRISKAALEATEARLDEAIRHAESLNRRGRVFDVAEWRSPLKHGSMAGIKSSVTITKSDGKAVKFSNDDLDFVKKYNERSCPSYFKREFLHKIFN